MSERIMAVRGSGQLHLEDENCVARGCEHVGNKLRPVSPGPINWATLHAQGVSVVNLIQRVLDGKGSMEEEFFVTMNLDQRFVASVAHVMVAKMQQVEITNGMPDASQVFVDDPRRCAVCGWPLVFDSAMGCTPGNCSMRPRPAKLYSPQRAKAEENMPLSREAIDLRVLVEGAEDLMTGRAGHAAYSVGNVVLVLEKKDGKIYLRAAKPNPNLRPLAQEASSET